MRENEHSNPRLTRFQPHQLGMINCLAHDRDPRCVTRDGTLKRRALQIAIKNLKSAILAQDVCQTTPRHRIKTTDHDRDGVALRHTPTNLHVAQSPHKQQPHL